MGELADMINRWADAVDELCGGEDTSTVHATVNRAVNVAAGYHPLEPDDA